MAEQQQAVIVTRLSDRHRYPTSEGREFAESVELVAPAGPLPAVLRAVADTVELLDWGLGRYQVSVGAPFDGEEADRG